MRALSSLLLAGAVGLGGLLSMPEPAAAADGYGGWRGRNYYRDYVPPQARVPLYGYNYGGGFGYGSQFYYGAPGSYNYGPRLSYGVRPGPGVGLSRGFQAYGVPPGPGVGGFTGYQTFNAAPGLGAFGGVPAFGGRSGIGVGLGIGGGGRR